MINISIFCRFCRHQADRTGSAAATAAAVGSDPPRQKVPPGGDGCEGQRHRGTRGPTDV